MRSVGQPSKMDWLLKTFDGPLDVSFALRCDGVSCRYKSKSGSQWDMQSIRRRLAITLSLPYLAGRYDSLSQNKVDDPLPLSQSLRWASEWSHRRWLVQKPHVPQNFCCIHSFEIFLPRQYVHGPR